MKKVVVVGCSSLIVNAAELLNPLEMKVVGLGDTRPEAWNVFKDNGDLKDEFDEMPVMPVDLSVGLDPDVIVIAAADDDTANSLRYTVIKAGYLGDVIFLNELTKQFSVAGAALRHAAQRLEALGVSGAAAELGCYQGNVSWQLSALMPERTLYLFDTFTGLDARDVAAEKEKQPDTPLRPGRYADAKAEGVLARLPNPDKAVVKQGWFPETALDLEAEKFALVYMDAGLYAPNMAGLQFFFPRMSQGGIILLMGAADPACPSVGLAVADFERRYGALLMLPVGDVRGSVMIIHP